ncbi:MAG: class I SAM-dependent methyltransferase [Capsulimonadaceae bacterium]
MDEETALFLLSAAGRDLLDSEAGEGEPLRALPRLRRKVNAQRAAAAWELIQARRRAGVKFGADAARMYFTAEALEQASSAAASAYHASRMAEAGIRLVVDLTGGIGADALAFARAGLRVDLFEIDPARALFAAENCRVAGFEQLVTVQCADSNTVIANPAPEWILRESAAWLDPSRRIGGRRLHDPEDGSPPLSIVGALRAAGFLSIGVKLSPAVDHAALLCHGGLGEFLSDCGECKEALLWIGALDTRLASIIPAGPISSTPAPRAGSSSAIRATVLSVDGIHTLVAEDPPHDLDSNTAGRIGFDAGGISPAETCFLYEPDPAVIRAHLVGALAQRLNASPVDPNIAYLIGPAFVSTPYARGYRVLNRFPYHLRTLQRRLRELGAGCVVIKKRGFPLEPDDVRKQLKLTGRGEFTVVLTRVGAQHQAIICEPVER